MDAEGMLDKLGEVDPDKPLDPAPTVLRGLRVLVRSVRFFFGAPRTYMVSRRR